MSIKEIQIVAFNNPFPADYGGVIDMFYKIKAFNELGLKIYLHIFYNDRSDISGLTSLCESIYLYKRNTSFIKHLSLIPYSINSRFSKELIENLNKSEAPIVFESLRTLAVINKHAFSQKIAIRCHNIEHDYSWGLFKSERSWLKKIAFFIETYKLKRFELILNKADLLLPLSYFEYNYYNKNFKSKTFFLPVFQPNREIESLNGFGKYALYHGDLSVSDNLRSAFFMIDVFNDLKEHLVIASSTENQKLIDEVNKHKNITFQLISNESQLVNLIKEAHVNTLFSFQRSGTKLKVFNALFNGRYCVLNSNMIDDPDILQICEIAENKIEYQKVVANLFMLEFVLKQERFKALKKYDSEQNAKEFIEVLL